MIYRIQDTTDSRYEGVRVTFDTLPHIGDIFTYKEIEFKIKEIVLSKNTLQLISDNYIVTFVLDEPIEE